MRVIETRGFAPGDACHTYALMVLTDWDGHYRVQTGYSGKGLPTSDDVLRDADVDGEFDSLELARSRMDEWERRHLEAGRQWMWVASAMRQQLTHGPTWEPAVDHPSHSPVLF